MNVAVIPARGGSKRIPRKNLKPFCGLPIIAHSIRAAIDAKVFDRIVVSTDDPEIASYAKSEGAEAPFVRPASLSDDHATTVPVIKHAIEWIQEHRSPVGNVCCLYATAPFVRARDLQAAHSILVERKVGAYVFSAASFPFPIQRAFRVAKDGHVEMFEPANYDKRSQDLEPAYQDAGQFYWGSAGAFIRNEMFFARESIAYLLPRHRVQDIDTPEDWTRAELMFRMLADEDDRS